MYAEFTDYENIFLLGRDALIPEASFPFYSTNASLEIDKHTFNRLYDLDLLEEFIDEVIRATCAIAELLWNGENETEVSSISHGGFSQSFVKDNKTSEDKIRTILARELGNTGLLFRG